MNKLFVLSLTVVAVASIAQAISNENIDITVDVDPDSKTYHQFKTREGSFNYGYNVAKKHFNQFQHKVRGPDDVTYGCYGFVDPKNGTHLYHYLSDLKGYRVVPPNKPTKIYRQRVAESVKQLLEAVEENIPWEQLYFPEVCRHLYLSHKQSNKFILPPEYIINDDGSVTKENKLNRPSPAKPSVVEPVKRITPDASQPHGATAGRPAPPRIPVIYTDPVAPAVLPPPIRQTRPTTTYPSPNPYPQGQGYTVRASVPAPVKPTAAPNRVGNDFANKLNDYPSKISGKPNEGQPAPKPAPNGVGVRRPNEPQATTKTETVLYPGNKQPQDLDAIHQDVREVKATLMKLLEHIFSRKADCDTPSARAPAGVHPGAPANPTGHVTAYLPLVLADFPAGAPLPAAHPAAPVATVPGAPSHPTGTVKLALPAYPAYQPPQCPVCRSDSGKK